MNPTHLLHCLNLAWVLARRDLKTRYASSYAGMIWHIGVPLIYTLINVLVFSILVKGRMGDRYGDIPFALFYLVPFSLWTFFAEVVNRSTGILREYRYLVNKIAFPFWVLPLVPMASAMLTQLIVIAMTGAVMAYHGILPAASLGWYVYLWGLCAMLTLGVAYATAALAVYIPDLAQIVPITVNIIFWLTPILYPAVLVREYGADWVSNLIMHYNPFFYLVEMTRDAVFGTGRIELSVLAALSGIALGCLVTGFLVFRKLKRGFADVI